MGFTKAIAPIKVNDIVFGYISIGPVLDSNDKAETLKKCVENGWYDTGKEKLSLALDKMVCKDTGYIKAAAKMLETYVSHLCLAKLISVDEGNLVYRISSHIRENLHEDLSVEKLCDVFMLSRRKLYELSSKYFGMSIAKYIRKRRIDFAAELIDESECLVCEAADRAGFEDSNYFSKVFKQEKGVLPSRYKVIEKPGDH
jgi:AraC-like DNA-binding protein